MSSNIATADEALALSTLDSLLDGTLDDLADLSSFEPFPNGLHRVSVVFNKKAINKHPAIEAKFTMIETLEYATAVGEEATSKQTKAGDTCSAAFMLDNDIAQGKFKALVIPIGEALGLSKLIDIVTATAEGFECSISTKIKKYTKDGQEREQLDIQKLIVS